MLLFVLWHGGGGGKGEGGGGGGEGGWLAIAVELLPLSSLLAAVVACRMLPLVTRWDIMHMHVTGHGAGNPKPCHRYGFFGGTEFPTHIRTPEKPVAKPVTFPTPQV